MAQVWGMTQERFSATVSARGKAPAGGSVPGMLAHGDFVGALSPAHVLGHFEGIPIVFVTAELWTQCLFIRLCAGQNERTGTLDEQWARGVEQFTHEVLAARERGDEAARPEPPEDPAVVLIGAPLIVSDDLATVYQSTSGSAGGSDNEWRGERGFEPSVPVAATMLTVRLDTSEGAGLACDVPLQDFAVASLPR
jgi:hypothetical protein